VRGREGLAEQIRRRLHIMQRKCFVNLVDAAAGAREIRDGLVVLGAFTDGLGEDGGVGSHTRDQVVANQASEMPVSQPGAANIVEPDALAQCTDTAQWIGNMIHGYSTRFARRCSRRATEPTIKNPHSAPSWAY